jgi:hypothetical protein
VYFSGTDSSGHRGLWVTDGTAAGTHLAILILLRVAGRDRPANIAATRRNDGVVFVDECVPLAQPLR